MTQEELIKKAAEQEELIKKAAEWLYLSLNLPEDEKLWWVNDFVDYMTNE